MLYPDPTRPTEELLKEIFNDTLTGMGSNKPGMAATAFATLLVKLSKEAENTASSVNKKTSQLITLTKWLIGLTVALIVLTVAFLSKDGMTRTCWE
jgi:hypothetical protein